jgi:hypothetical protein
VTVIALHQSDHDRQIDEQHLMEASARGFAGAGRNTCFGEACRAFRPGNCGTFGLARAAAGFYPGLQQCGRSTR